MGRILHHFIKSKDGFRFGLGEEILAFPGCVDKYAEIDGTEKLKNDSETEILEGESGSRLTFDEVVERK